MTEQKLREDEQTPTVAENEPDAAEAIWAEQAALENGKPLEVTDTPAATPEDAETKEAGSEPTAEAADPVQGTDAQAKIEKLQREAEKLEQAERSAAGRREAHMREIERLRKVAAGSGQPAKTDIREIMKPLSTDFPEIAEHVERAVTAVESRVSNVEAAEAARQNEARAELDRISREQRAEFDSLHPDFNDIMKTRGNEFLAWVDDQPKAVRKIVDDNWKSIVDAKATSEILKRFLNPSAPQTSTPPPDNRRQRQLAATASPQSSNRKPVAAGIPEDGDPEEIWRMAADMERRASH